MTVDDPDVGVAFALVCGAGAATALGASVVFFPSLVKLASRRVLAGALGISAGVMTYVSFVEIFSKSVSSFEDAGHSEEHAYVYATLCFFGGVAAMILVDFTVKVLSGGHHHHHHDHESHSEGEIGKDGSSEEPQIVAPHCVGCSDDPVGELNEWQNFAEEEIENENRKRDDEAIGVTVASAASSGETDDRDNREESSDTFDDNDGEGSNRSTSARAIEPQSLTLSVSGTPNENAKMKPSQEKKKLVRMGVNTALAIGLHNFPEGLATFVAALDDPRVGAVLAIAIGIHNIPEGLCVALPIYYATGNRVKAFLWALISGISEPIAALLGWAVLANSFSDTLYAVLFGIVAGMMVIISAKELIPTAHRYDPDDTVVTYSLIAGMVIIALSLVLFVI